MEAGNTTYVIVRDGQGHGGMLRPPGHRNHTHVLKGYGLTGTGRRRREPFLLASLELALTEDYIPEGVRAQAERIMASATLVCSELWLRHVYGYFRSMYSVDGTRNVSAAKPDSELTAEQRVPDRHLAVMYVRDYFPDHEPRHDLIDPAPGVRLYGQWPCRKCGERVQYEGRADALCLPLTTSRDCPKGGLHEWADGDAPTTDTAL